LPYNKTFFCQELELQQQVCSSRKEDMSGSSIKYEPSMVASIPICFWSQPGTPTAHRVAGALRTAVAVWSMRNPFPRQCSTAPKADVVIVVVGDCIAYMETCCSWNSPATGTNLGLGPTLTNSPFKHSFSKCLALEAHHVHGEDPRVHVFAPDNADSPSCRRRCHRSRCWGGTARTLPRQPLVGPSARGAAQNDVCLAAPVYLGQ